jgi:hypothetical protein
MQPKSGGMATDGAQIQGGASFLICRIFCGKLAPTFPENALITRT